MQERRVADSLARQNLSYDTGQKPAGRLALPQFPVDRIAAAAQHGERCDHDGPEHAEFVAAFRQRPYIADLEMSTQEHRHQQIYRSEQCNGACEETQCEADRANEFDRPGECNLHHRQRHAQARKIKGVYLDLTPPAENVTPEVRDEYQAYINPDECQCRSIE